MGMKEEGKRYWGSIRVTPESLGISKEIFHKRYTNHIKQGLVELKETAKKEYNEL